MYSHSQTSNPVRQAFIVRVWWEEDDTGAPTLLRGILQDAYNRDEFAFASLEELVVLLTSYFQPPHDSEREADR